MSTARLAAQVVIALALAGAGGLLWYRFAPRHVPAGQPPLTHLSATTLGRLRADFNAASDVKRLVLLLSPT